MSSVLSKWSLPGGSSKKKGIDDDSSIGASMANLSLLTEDPYARTSAQTIDSETDLAYSNTLGTLIIVVMKAKNLYNRRAISKQNPYCSVRVAKHSDRTKAITRGGQAPVWDHESRFKLKMDDNNQILKLCVFDQNGSNTDIIGDAMIQLKPAMEASPSVGYDDWFPIHFNKRYVGEVYLEMTFYPAKHSRRSSNASSVSSHSLQSSQNSQRNALRSKRSGSSMTSGPSSRSSSPIRSQSPIRSSPLQQSNSSSFSTRAQANVKHSESMPILNPINLGYEADRAPIKTKGSRRLPYASGDASPLDWPEPDYSNSTGYDISSPAPSQTHSRRPVRPLPQLPDLESHRHSMPPVPMVPQIPHHSSFAPPELSSNFPAQEDISKQINDGYEASLFERLKPQ